MKEKYHITVNTEKFNELDIKPYEDKIDEIYKKIWEFYKCDNAFKTSFERNIQNILKDKTIQELIDSVFFDEE